MAEKGWTRKKARVAIWISAKCLVLEVAFRLCFVQIDVHMRLKKKIIIIIIIY